MNENLVYLVFPDLMLFAKSELEGEQSEPLLERIFGFVEEAAQCQDASVIEMLRDTLHELATPDPDKANARMGRSTRKLFRQVVKEVYG